MIIDGMGDRLIDEFFEINYLPYRQIVMKK